MKTYIIRWIAVDGSHHEDKINSMYPQGAIDMLADRRQVKSIEEVAEIIDGWRQPF